MHELVLVTQYHRALQAILSWSSSNCVFWFGCFGPKPQAEAEFQQSSSVNARSRLMPCAYVPHVLLCSCGPCTACQEESDDKPKKKIMVTEAGEQLVGSAKHTISQSNSCIEGRCGGSGVQVDRRASGEGGHIIPTKID